MPCHLAILHSTHSHYSSFAGLTALHDFACTAVLLLYLHLHVHLGKIYMLYVFRLLRDRHADKQIQNKDTQWENKAKD